MIDMTNIINPFLVSPCTTWPIPGKNKEIIAAIIGLTLIHPPLKLIKKINTNINCIIFILTLKIFKAYYLKANKISKK